MNGFTYISNLYNVPAKRGASIEYNGKRGHVTGANGPHVKARLDGETHAKCYHPLDLKWLAATEIKGGCYVKNQANRGRDPKLY